MRKTKKEVTILAFAVVAIVGLMSDAGLVWSVLSALAVVSFISFALDTK